MKAYTVHYIELFKRGCFDPFVIIDNKKHLKQEQALNILTDNETTYFDSFR